MSIRRSQREKSNGRHESWIHGEGLSTLVAPREIEMDWFKAMRDICFKP